MLTYENLPQLVKEAAKELFPFYNFIKSALDASDSEVWFNADHRGDDLTNNPVYTGSHRTHESLESKGIKAAHIDVKLSDKGNWIFVKKSDFPAWRVTKPIVQAMNLAPNSWNEHLGEFGTSPLFSMLTSGLLGGGLGYLGGALGEAVIPDSVLEPGKLRKRTALLGALAGAAGPAYLGTVGMRNNKEEGKSPFKAWVEPNVFFGAQKKAIHKAYAAIKAKTNDESIEEAVKQAFEATDTLHIPSIPVDAFNRAVINDPYTSLPLQVATAGLMEAANQSKGNVGLISPFDIARVGIGMGAGLTQAYLGGKVLGALAGLTPGAQKTLQQAGMFAGALKAVVPGLFGKEAEVKHVKIDVKDDAGKKLLHHFIRANEWGSPAGAIEDKESPRQAAARELLERTGYSINPDDLQDLGADAKFHNFAALLNQLKREANPGERGSYSTKIKWS